MCTVFGVKFSSFYVLILCYLKVHLPLFQKHKMSYFKNTWFSNSEMHKISLNFRLQISTNNNFYSSVVHKPFYIHQFKNSIFPKQNIHQYSFNIFKTNDQWFRNAKNFKFRLHITKNINLCNATMHKPFYIQQYNLIFPKQNDQWFRNAQNLFKFRLHITKTSAFVTCQLTNFLYSLFRKHNLSKTK